MALSGEPARRDVTIWYGDDDPPLIWTFGDSGTPDILAGSTFVLIVQWRDGEMVRRSDDAASGLVMDAAARTVTWGYGAPDTAAIPRGPCRYQLQRVIAGRTRTWVWGALVLKLGLLRA